MVRQCSEPVLAAARTGYLVSMDPTMHEGPGPLKDVVDGMTVVDAEGQTLGTVTELRMGDAEAATTAGQEDQQRTDVVTTFVRSLLDDFDLPEQTATRLVRLGYFRIDRPMARDQFVAADQVDRVEGESVHLSVAEAILATRR